MKNRLRTLSAGLLCLMLLISAGGALRAVRAEDAPPLPTATPRPAELQMLVQGNVSPMLGQPIEITLNGHGILNSTCAVQVMRDGEVVDTRTIRGGKFIYKPTQTGLYTFSAQQLDGNGAVKSEASFETSVTEKAFYYSVLDDGTCSIDGCAASRRGELHLPEVIYGHTVTAIDRGAFIGCSDFTGNLTLPDSITAIGSCAFLGCSGFTGNLTLPAGLTQLGSRAFADCTGFTGDLTLPAGLTTIYGFDGCSGFNGKLTLPDGAITIGENAFQGCSGFTGALTLPAGLTTIEDSAFSLCSGFTGNLILPEGVTTIGNHAFSCCEGFTGDLTLPAGLTTLGAYAFAACSGFTGKLTLPAGLTTIEEGVFTDCSGFTGGLSLPAGVTAIGRQAFYQCAGFDGELALPAGLTTIGEIAFDHCSGFTGQLVLPDGLTTIDRFAFSDCSGFTGQLVLPAGLKTIGEGAFHRCTGFTGDLVFPDGLTTIDEDAFACCTGFTGRLVLPDGLTEIKEDTFSDCDGFTSITIPNKETVISPNSPFPYPKSSDLIIPIYGKLDSYAQTYVEELHRLGVYHYGFIPDTYPPHTYRAVGHGIGDVIVTMTFDGETIVDVQINTDNEMYFGQIVGPILAERILAAQTAKVDGVSGASFTSRAVIYAAQQCIAMAKCEMQHTSGAQAQ